MSSTTILLVIILLVLIFKDSKSEMEVVSSKVDELTELIDELKDDVNKIHKRLGINKSNDDLEDYL